MTTYYPLLLSRDEERRNETKNLQLESSGNLYPFCDNVDYANYSDIWRIMNAGKKIIHTIRFPIFC